MLRVVRRIAVAPYSAPAPLLTKCATTCGVLIVGHKAARWVADVHATAEQGTPLSMVTTANMSPKRVAAASGTARVGLRVAPSWRASWHVICGKQVGLSQGAPEQPRTTEGPPVQHAASSKRDNRGTDFFGLIRPRRAAVSGCQAALDTTIVAPPPRSTHLTFSTSLKLPSARTHARARRARLVEVPPPPSRARENALLAKWRASGARLTLTRRSQSRGRLPPSRKMPSRKMPRSGLRTATSCVGCGETSCGPSSWAQLRRLAVCSVCHACAAPINRPRAADTLLPRSQATRFGICAPSAAERWCCS